MKKAMGIFLSYLKRHVTVLIAAALLVCIFTAVFYLYNLPLEAVFYAAGLTAGAIAVLGVIRFAAFYKRHQALLALRTRIANELTGLPEPLSVIEEDYQELLYALYENRVTLLSKADRAKSDMIDYYTIWAHQIKTPIATMHLLLQTEETVQAEQLSTELFKVEQYVEMVLGYLRLESTSTDYVLKKYDLDGIIRQAVRKYARLFIGKKIGIHYSGIPVSVLTDEKWLLFVFEQVLSNAIKYTKAGAVSIYLEEPRTLVIEDTGIGIAPEDLPRVFEKGYTGYNGRADKKATGIGLYLCRRILQKLGHSIEIESQVDVGTKVKIALDTVELQRE